MSLDKQTLTKTLELGGYRWERLKNKHFGHMYNSKGECIGRGVPYKEALALLTPTPLLTRPIPTTRTQEPVRNALVNEALVWLNREYLETWKVIEAYIAKLEASQPAKGYDEIMVEIVDREGLLPKPQQSDEGLATEITNLVNSYHGCRIEHDVIPAIAKLLSQASAPVPPELKDFRANLNSKLADPAYATSYLMDAVATGKQQDIENAVKDLVEANQPIPTTNGGETHE